MEGTMKKVVITGERQAELVEMPIPKPVGNWVLLKVHVVPMCTEYKAWLHGPRKPGSRINALGHEGVGEVVEVAQPCGLEVGDRVVINMPGGCGRCIYCRAGFFLQCIDRINYAEFTGETEPTGSFAQYRLGDAWSLPKIPDGISFKHGAMAWCGLGPTFGAMQTARVDSYDTLLITGAGPVGQGGVVNAKYRGARVIVAELEPWRKERVKQLGADAVVDPRDEDVLDQIRGMTGGLGVTAAIDCSGVVAAQRLCVDATRPHGRVCFVGECGEPMPLTISPDMIRKSLRLIGQWHYSLADVEKMMRIISDSGDKLEILISHQFPMSQVQEAFATSASRQCGKIVLDPWQ